MNNEIEALNQEFLAARNEEVAEIKIKDGARLFSEIVRAELRKESETEKIMEASPYMQQRPSAYGIPGNTVVLYHADCADGFGAAYACWTYFQDNATYIPVKYGQPVPDLPEAARVFIVDFSYSQGNLAWTGGNPRGHRDRPPQDCAGGSARP